MKGNIRLSKAVRYPKKRISINEITLDNYVTTDSLLPNKTGITKAINLPPQEGTLPVFEKNDILVANIRPYLKKIWFADKDGGCSSDVIVFRVNKGFDPRFIYYALFRDDFFKHMMRGKKGTKMPRGDKKHILSFLLPDFDLHTQQRIGQVLSSIDRRIEVNNQINKTLEETMKSIFEYWFIQFDFPNNYCKPYIQRKR